MLQEAELAEIAARAGERERQDPESYPDVTMRELFECGFISAPFTNANGGSGWSCLDATKAIETLATQSPSAALLAAMPIGFAGVTAAVGDLVPESSRADWMEQLALITEDFRAGKHYAACNSEAGAGGSLDATKTVASKASGAWRLTGRKILASGGAHTDVFFSTAKVTPAELPDAGVVEVFLLRADAAGVSIANDWDGFGMRSTESQSVAYEDAAALRLWGFPNFLEVTQPLGYWFNLFAAIPLGCASGMFDVLSHPAPTSPAVRLRLADSRMRLEALGAYLHETAANWRPAAGAAYAGRVLRTKTYVSQEATRLCAELFALSGGRHYRRADGTARLLADSFAGTALRPPLALALDGLVEQFDS